ncbi:MAG TPA: hypothetical protein VKS22_03040 [Candidatus Binataceae bacterium]|nr:hypothetical protein [Candidatus Binataceae bacterium]
MKTFGVALALVMMLMLARSAMADAVATAKATDQAYDAALLACTPGAALDFFEDHAAAIFPGDGELGGGKAEIAPLVKNFDAAFCPDAQHKAALKTMSLSATSMGPDFIMIVRQFEATDKLGNSALVRATELIHEKDGKWRYLVVHVSVGLPRASASDVGKPAQ